MLTAGDVASIRFDANGLVPAIVQAADGKVLMLAYMNKEALERTLATGETWFFSRSRQALWHKGATSGHFQRVLDIAADCDSDALLVTVEQTGVACHTGAESCFHRPLASAADPAPAAAAEAAPAPAAVLSRLEAVLQQRRTADPATSYTASLLADLDRACKKVGEEATEVVLAVKNEDRANLVHEAADLLYHTLVLLVAQGLSLADVTAELARRQRGA